MFSILKISQGLWSEKEFFLIFLKFILFIYLFIFLRTFFFFVVDLGMARNSLGVQW